MHRLIALLPAAALLALAPGAHAMQSCAGTIGTSLLHPLPSPLSIASERPMTDAANPQLTRLFVQGLSDAGITLSANGNVTASMSAEVTPPTDALVSNNAPAPSGTYSNFDWTMGEQMAPGEKPVIKGSVLMLSLQLTDNASATIAWLATIQCTIQTNDANLLVSELGRAVGNAIGKNFISQPL